MSRARSMRALIRDVMAAPGVAAAHGVSDPLNLAVRVVRSVPPVQRLVRPGDRGSRGTWSAVRWLLADEPDRAREALTGDAGSRVAQRFAGELAAHLGEPVDAQGVLAARAAAYRGDLSDAVRLAAGTRYAIPLRAEQRRLTPGWRLANLPPRVVRREVDSTLLVLNNSLPWTHSGYTARTHRMACALQRRGVRVDAVTRLGYPLEVGGLGAGDRDVVDGVTYRRLTVSRFPRALEDRLAQQAARMLPLVAELRPGVLHTTTDYTNALVTSAVSSATGVPWVYEMRGQIELTWAASRRGSARGHAETSERVRLLRDKETELAREASAVIVLSDVQRQDMVSRGVDPSRLLVLRNSVDDAVLARPAVSSAAARRARGLPTDGIWVGSVTSVVGYEGLDTLVRAVADARAAGTDLRAAIVGTGAALPGLQALVDELGLGDVVLLPGRVSAHDALSWHEALDVMVVPRQDTPVCRMVTPLKPLEAMALRRPVVASDTPALRELVGEPGAGLLVPPEDVAALAETLVALAEQPQRRAELAEAGRRYAEQQTWDHVAAELHELYRALR